MAAGGWRMAEANIVTPFWILMMFMFALHLASSFIFIRFSISCCTRFEFCHQYTNTWSNAHQASGMKCLFSRKTVIFQSNYKWLWLNAYRISNLHYLVFKLDLQWATCNCVIKTYTEKKTNCLMVKIVPTNKFKNDDLIAWSIFVVQSIVGLFN